MKQTEAQSVGEIIRQVVESDDNRDEFLRQKACYLWTEVVGPDINRQTIRRYVDGNTLHVFLASAPLKSELAFVAEALVRQLNEAVGTHVIHKLVIH